jgi:hypothetical protein
MCYGLDSRGSNPGSGKIFLFTTSQQALEAHPMGTVDDFAVGKTAGT